MISREIFAGSERQISIPFANSRRAAVLQSLTEDPRYPGRSTWTGSFQHWWRARSDRTVERQERRALETRAIVAGVSLEGQRNYRGVSYQKCGHSPWKSRKRSLGHAGPTKWKYRTPSWQWGETRVGEGEQSEEGRKVESERDESKPLPPSEFQEPALTNGTIAPPLSLASILWIFGISTESTE